MKNTMQKFVLLKNIKPWT